jgi:hypothetical protein
VIFDFDVVGANVASANSFIGLRVFGGSFCWTHFGGREKNVRDQVDRALLWKLQEADSRARGQQRAVPRRVDTLLALRVGN